jgi:hypothetical protein
MDNTDYTKAVLARAAERINAEEMAKREEEEAKERMVAEFKDFLVSKYRGEITHVIDKLQDTRFRLVLVENSISEGVTISAAIENPLIRFFTTTKFRNDKDMFDAWQQAAVEIITYNFPKAKVYLPLYREAPGEPDYHITFTI